MGTVAFQWEDSKLTLLMNRNNYEGQVTKKATWDESNTILGSWFDKRLRGTWFGFSKAGRLAFMVEPLREHGGDDELFEYITRFLKGAIAINQFSDRVAERCKNRQSTNVVVVDLDLKSMVYLQKKASSVPIYVKKVGHGVHTLSDTGLDSESPKDVRLRERYHDVIAGNEPPMIDVLVQELMTDPVQAEQGNEHSSVFVDVKSAIEFHLDTQIDLQRYRTTSSTALEVQLDGGKFYQKLFMSNGDCEEDGFNFSMLI
ncbi:Transport and Golgi organization protein 2 [Arabidopsis thaliana x Arabidopsis arenosa]|uniref:Transport and Golgi organization protein 2 n=1 Tax=Arabidopsis thaliana x Arabidopsis arenosa TaxID=1240361 RepID=A0A8T2BYG5_9BRAS|nr:Transport and Golgi organization protein 2 [Arabidopsis thaliana x Arabidopsis arenosa]